MTVTTKKILIVLAGLAVAVAALIVGAYRDERGDRFGGGVTDISLGELWFPVFVLLVAVFIAYGWPWMKARWFPDRTGNHQDPPTIPPRGGW